MSGQAVCMKSLSTKSAQPGQARSSSIVTDDDAVKSQMSSSDDSGSRRSFWATAFFNVAALLIPVLYQTYSDHIAGIDSTLGVIDGDALSSITTYTLIVLEGFPCAAWTIIGDKASQSTRERVGLCKTLITVQFMLGLLISYHVYSSAASFMLPSTSPELSKGGIAYIQLHAWTFCSTILEHSISTAMRAFDYPEIPFVMSIAKVGVHQAMTRFLVLGTTPNSGVVPVLTLLQINLLSSLLAAFVGLIDFIILYLNLMRQQGFAFPNPSLTGFLTLCPVGLGSMALSLMQHDPLWTQWLGFGTDNTPAVHNIVATKDARDTIIVAIVLGLEATTLSLCAQRYTAWAYSRGQSGWHLPSQGNLKRIATPAVLSAGIVAATIAVAALALKPPSQGLITFQPRPSGVVVTSTQASDLKDVLLKVIYLQGADLLFAAQPLPWLFQSLVGTVWQTWSKS